jgi:hypothetical protein
MVEKGDGKIIKKQLEEFKKNILAIDPEIAKTLPTALPINTEMPKTKNKSNKPWCPHIFICVPTVLHLPLLSKYQKMQKHQKINLYLLPCDKWAKLFTDKTHLQHWQCEYY